MSDFNIIDYLDDRDLKDIAQDVAADQVRRHLQREVDFERLIANVAYMTVWPAVDEAMGEDAKAAIAAKIPEIISDMSQFSVFRKAGDTYSCKEDSVGQKLLEEAVMECKELIRERVMEIIGSLSPYTVREMVREAVEDAVISWMDGGAE